MPNAKEPDDKFRVTLEYAQNEARAIVAELEPDELGGYSMENPPPEVREELKGKWGTAGWNRGLYKKSILEICTALIFARGNMAKAAKLADIDRRQLFRMANDERHPAIRAARDVGREIRLDEWEDELDYQILDQHNFVPLVFGLKTQGKKRGYIENQMVYHHIDVSALTDEQVRRLAEGEEPAAVLGERALKAPKEIIEVEAEDIDAP